MRIGTDISVAVLRIITRFFLRKNADRDDDKDEPLLARLRVSSGEVERFTHPVA